MPQIINYTSDQISRFIADSIIRVPHTSIDHHLVDAVAEAWLKFTDLPQAQKDPFGLDHKHDGADTGYNRKHRTGKEGAINGRDNKEYFHHRFGLKERFREELDETFSAELSELLDVSEELLSTLAEILKPFVAELDVHYPGMYQGFFPEGRKSSDHVLRLLKYYSTGDDILAAQHRDRNSLTFQVAESVEGLWGGIVSRWPNDSFETYKNMSQAERDAWVDPFLKEVRKRNPYELLLFAGGKMDEATQGTIQPFRHKVVTPPLGEDVYMRWAIVAFFHQEGIDIDGHNN